MDEKRNVPEVRFEGFEGEWSNYKIGDVISTAVRPIKMESNITYQCVTVKRRNEGVLSRGFFKGSDILVKSQFVVKSGEYLISKRQVVHGANGIIPDELDGAIVSNEYLVLQDTEKLRVNYLALISKLPSMYKAFFLSSYGVHVEKLLFDFEDWKTKVVCLPKICEQAGITRFFHFLDDTIALKKQQHEKTVNIKKAMLEKMFPKKGATVPEVRFDGFNEEWEKKALGDIAEFNPKGLLPEVFKYVDLESVVGTTMVSYRTEDRTTAPSRAQRPARRGDVFFQTVRPYQRNNFLFDLPDNDFVFSTGYAQLRPSIDSNFLLCRLQEDRFVSEVLDYSTGTSYPAITPTNLALIEILITPDPKEQAAIGNFFRNLDTLIAAQCEEIEKLQSIKKACLNKMFV